MTPTAYVWAFCTDAIDPDIYPTLRTEAGDRMVLCRVETFAIPGGFQTRHTPVLADHIERACEEDIIATSKQDEEAQCEDCLHYSASGTVHNGGYCTLRLGNRKPTLEDDSCPDFNGCPF